jgi:hypothetical protein
MFKKGGFEVSPVVYPVAVKVSLYCLTLYTISFNTTKKILNLSKSKRKVDDHPSKFCRNKKTN